MYYGAGIDNTDIVLLGSYTVYSHSREKAASRFFIMQCSQSINQEVIKVPLKDVIERFVLVIVLILMITQVSRVNSINVTSFPIAKIMRLVSVRLSS
jgi:hypothetical protein